MNKKQKLIYLTPESIEKLKLLQQINGIDQSKIIDILIKKQKNETLCLYCINNFNIYEPLCLQRR